MRIAAHEIGHYLGLGHTTELNGAADLLEDTPACADIANGPCPDADNLMFPISVLREPILTPDQVFVIERSPLLSP